VNRDEIIAALRAHEPELRAAGAASLSLVGSTARGDEQESSDIDVLVRLEADPARNGFAYFGMIDRLPPRGDCPTPGRCHRRAGAQAAPAARGRKGPRRCLLRSRCSGFTTFSKTSNATENINSLALE